MENKAEYITNADISPNVNDTFTLTLNHVGMIRDMIDRKIGKNKSAVVRMAIERLFAETLADSEN